VTVPASINAAMVAATRKLTCGSSSRVPDAGTDAPSRRRENASLKHELRCSAVGDIGLLSNFGRLSTRTSLTPDPNPPRCAPALTPSRQVSIPFRLRIPPMASNGVPPNRALTWRA
jgi:hypothetical protein